MENKNRDKFVYTDNDMAGITITKSGDITTVKHRFLDYRPGNTAETLIIGTLIPKQRKTRLISFIVGRGIFYGSCCRQHFLRLTCGMPQGRKKKILLLRKRLLLLTLLRK